MALDEALRSLIDITGCTVQEAIASVTETPARLLGQEGQIGRLAPGAAADMVLLGPQRQVCATFINGRPVYVAEGVAL
jgi:N-acetylglucosamine-6-phosphate deacetylase